MDNNDKKEGIILKSTKYGDNSLVVNILTHDSGLQPYIIKNVYGNKKGGRAALLQNTNIVNFVTIHNKLRSPIGQLKDIEIGYFYNTIPFDMNKMAIALFISEICAKTITGQEKNEDLYNFVRNSLTKLDATNENLAIFPICFVIGLCQHLGFAPMNNYSDNCYFDMTEGHFCAQMPDTHNYYFDLEKSRILSSFLTSDTFVNLPFRMSGETRRQLLDGLITFVRLHASVMGSIQSHEILRQVLS